MTLSFQRQSQPNIIELETLFENAFCELNEVDGASFSAENSQSLSQWFALDEINNQFKNGFLIEARDSTNVLLGAIFVAKQHLLTWPDGKKMEIFILSVDSKVRGQGIGKKLIHEAYLAAADFGAHSLIVNTHVSLISVHHFYKTLGFTELGTLKNYYDNGDAIFFQKILNKK